MDPQVRLRERDERGLRRTLDPVDRVGPRARRASDPRGAEPNWDAEYLVFAANDYLGLAGDERLAEAAAEAAREVGTGAGASRLVVGDTSVHRTLERDLADCRGTERALCFSSGYAANVGTLGALDPDLIFSDERNHASIVDGCRLAGADVEVYDHADPGALRERLAARTPRGDSEDWLIVTDSVFSMDGDVAPLGDICDAADEYGTAVMVDEAHATGVYEGGIVGREGLGDRVDVQLGTLSKALGAQGGYVAGSEPLIELLVNAARSFVFSTGLAPPAAAAAREGLRIARESDRPARLRERAETLRAGLIDAGFEVRGETHVLPVIVGERDDAVVLAAALRERGVLAPAIRPPAVPEGTSRLRVAPSAAHTEEAIEACLAALRGAAAEAGVGVGRDG
jgi:8-amino-7-oxononanoate synthase